MKREKKHQRWNSFWQKLNTQMNRNARLTLKGKSWNFRPIRLGVMVLGGLLALVILVQLLLIPVRRPKTVDMAFEAGGNYTMLPMGNHILMYNNQHLWEVNTRGKTVWSTDIAMSHPIVETAKDFILLSDLGGKNDSALYRDGKKIRDYNLDNDIISAKVTPKGWTVFATATLGYKGRVVVFDKRGKERFSWNSGEGYILDVAMTDSGRYLAVAQLSSDGTQADSKIQFIDMNRKKVVATAEREGTVISQLRFSKDRLLAVSESELCGFKTNGKLTFEVSFLGKNPSKYDISSDEVLAFVTTDNRGNAVLELYNTDGKLKGQYRADANITNLSVFEDMVVIAKQREILSISPRGKLKKTATADLDIKSLGLFGDGHTALAAGNTHAYIVRMR